MTRFKNTNMYMYMTNVYVYIYMYVFTTEKWPNSSYLGKVTTPGRIARLDIFRIVNHAFFPTCQVRVVRFYVSLPASFLPSVRPSIRLSLSFLLLPPPDLNCKL